MHTGADVVVVGAGPVGCVTALAHARRGAEVLLLEANPGRRNRFAGELLHPPAVAALAEAGIEHIPPADDHPANRGFAIFHGGRDPWQLHNPGASGRTFEFNRFVDTLQTAVRAQPRIRFAEGWRATGLRGDTLDVNTPEGGAEVRFGRLVGADGRFSVVRKMLGLPQDRTQLSHMAGLLLRGARLPCEGFGHVMLGAAGPVLAYRIAPDEIRVCVDVPPTLRRNTRREALIWERIAPQLPEVLRAPIEAELRAGRVVWAVNELRPRLDYGQGRVALVGDAVGHFHPMTGVGMTLGFGDAVALARHADLKGYAAERHAATLSPALLATALYEIFALDAPPTRALRRAIFDIWGSSDALRARTMGFLSCEDPSMPRLLAVGAQMVARAAVHAARDSASQRAWGEGVTSVGRIGGLVRWLLTESVPPSMRLIDPSVPPSTPFGPLREQLLAAQQAA